MEREGRLKMSFSLMSPTFNGGAEVLSSSNEFVKSVSEVSKFDPDDRIDLSKTGETVKKYNPDDRVDCSVVKGEQPKPEYKFDPDDRIIGDKVDTSDKGRINKCEAKSLNSPENPQDIDTQPQANVLDVSEPNGDISNFEQPKDISTFAIDKPDVITIQKEEISKVINGEQALDDTLKKGNFGEMVTDVELKGLGYDRVSLDAVTSLNDITHKGIDGVYFNDNGKSQYLIVDSKYGSAQLSDTMDGKQMSDSWIDKRLDDAVGKEKADDIRIAQLFDPDNVCKLVAHVKEDGQVIFDKLDCNGDVIERNVNIND